jgi:large subunit ribosomal protein LP0
MVVNCDNVVSAHMQKIRKALRGKGVIMMGKNTMMRKVIRGYLEQNPTLETLLPWVYGNIGFIFAKGDLSEIRKVVLAEKKEAAAKAGAIAPVDVWVRAGNTGLEPTQTSFLQALNIPSKINKGQVEIVADVHLIHEGSKVGSSEAALLQKLNIKPFQYGLRPQAVFDNGSVYDPKLLDMSDEDLITKFKKGVQNIAAISLAIGHPTVASIPHSVIRGYKNVLAIALTTEFTFPQAQKVKDILANPGKFAPAPAPTPKKEEAKPVKKEEKKKEEAPPEEEDLGFGLFD